MRFRNLSQLKSPELLEVALGSLPEHILMTEYAKDKAFKICELVADVFAESYEWYGFTLAEKGRPELITDIGLPGNDLNLHDRTSLGSDRIAEFQESLPGHLLINGWIHSHGALDYRHFSSTDEKNQLTVLDFIAARTRKPLVKKQIAIRDLVFLEKGRFAEEDLENGSVTLITDGPITEAKILETVYGSFCYSIVVGDAGWHQQEIHCQERAILSGYMKVASKAARIVPLNTGKVMTQSDMVKLRYEVEKKIRPNLNPPLETTERM